MIRTLVALGSGDPATVPLAAWRALETADAVSVPDDETLAGWLGEQGIDVRPGAPVVAASGPRLLHLLRDGSWDETVPAGAALDGLVAASALTGLWELTARLRRDCPWTASRPSGRSCRTRWRKRTRWPRPPAATTRRSCATSWATCCSRPTS